MDFDGRELRNALGRFATGVCLVTTHTEDGLPMALTVNSFSSVSLNPPLVLWSLQNDSDVYKLYAEAKRFGINVLAREQEPLSTGYALKDEHQLKEGHFSAGKHGAPLIRNALVSFECELEATHQGGDHLIIVGRVLDIHSRPDGEPLLFYAGDYRELA